MTRRKFAFAVSTAVSGMLAARRMARGAGAAEEKRAKHVCKGRNECKGQGGCKTGDNGCAGKNSCKGKGGCAVPLKSAKQKKSLRLRRRRRVAA